jgi:hypothetical protein
MKQVMIFMSYRTCSKTLINSLGALKDYLQITGEYPEVKEKRLEGKLRGNFIAATTPPGTCPVIFRRDGVDIQSISDRLTSDYQQIIYWARLENSIHPSLEASNLSSLSGDWKFVVLIRDGRDQIESWMKFRGRRRPMAVAGEAAFIDMCNGWKKRAQHAKSLLENFDCKLVKFEDFVKDIDIQFRAITDYIDLVPDTLYLNAVRSMTEIDKTKEKASWKDWDKNKLDTFYSIAGEEMEYFNYI